jgi:acyl-CoA carboxylase subunit beta
MSQLTGIRKEQRSRVGARELLEGVLDVGSFVSWDRPVALDRLPASYAEELRAAAAKTGVDEAVVTGEGTVRGRRVAVVVSEFGFLAGSIGSATARRIVELFERATAEGLPVLASPASGGTRMQEGTPAFALMMSITAAVRRHKEAGLAYLVYLRHPTTGGVMASWGSLGHVTIGEPGALLGFLGPRVFEALNGARFPEGVQVAENLYERGLIDAVVPLDGLAEVVERAIGLLSRADGIAPVRPDVVRTMPASVAEESEAQREERVWASIATTRDPRRPSVRHLLKYGARDVLQLSGTAQGERDARLVLALARLGGRACVVVGQDRSREPVQAMGPALLREARRGMRLAAELRIPLVTVIDTEGASLSREAEEGGMAGAIARSLSDLVGLRTPVVSVLLGQGTGGGAIALMPGDITIAAEHAWLAPLPPEGASAILFRDVGRAKELAAAQRVDAWSLLEAGVVQEVVLEGDGAAARPREFSERLAGAIGAALDRLADVPTDSLLMGRERKLARMG